MGADPPLRTKDYEPYLQPGEKLPVDVAMDDPEVRGRLLALEKKYADTPKVRMPHPDIGCWWTLYDYGLDTVREWAFDYKHPYPEIAWREKQEKERLKAKALKKAKAMGLSTAEAAAMAGLTGAEAAAAAAPQTPVAFLFPGQGSQAVGMCKDCAALPKVKEMFATASKVLGYDLLDVCLNGPKEKLDNTVYSQPALFVGGLAAVEKLRMDNPDKVDEASCTAGLSLGEYTALVFAGAMSFEDAITVVKVRAEGMAAAAAAGDPHGMLSVVGLGDAEIESVCKTVRDKMPGKTCQVANLLFPQGRVVSGHHDALDEVQKLATAKGALKVTKVAVSGAFHTPLMAPASEALSLVLDSVEIKDPRIPVYSNVTSQPFQKAADIKGLLKRQLVEPVLWEATVKAIIAKGKNALFELGPGQQVKAMTKRIDVATWKNMVNVKV
jgi:[acyl-carrier-protein] S-malonyltransferase